MVNRDDHVQYIEALETADEGELKRLVALFIQIQKRSLLQAIQLASAAQPAHTVDECVAAVRASLVAKGQIIPEEWARVKQTANSLLNLAQQRLQEVANKLRTEIASVRPQFQFTVGTGEGASFTAPQEVAKQLKYIANLAEHHEWVQLHLKTEQSVRFVISFHGLGTEFRGLLAVSALLIADGEVPVAVSDDFFQLNYKEDNARADKRFRPWLESAIIKGLTLWRQKL